MMEYKKLSVVMSVYQRAHLIERTIMSLMQQEIPPDEIVIVDDASTDNLRGVVKRLQQAYRSDTDIRYYYNNNPGWTICVHGMNCGIKLASHELIMLTMPEILHATDDVKIIKGFFANPENKPDRTFFFAEPLYEMRGYELLYSLTMENFKHPMTITKLPCVNKWYVGLETLENTITHFSRGGLHHIAGVLKKDLINIRGYDEGFLSGGAGGYDDVDLLTRFRWYGKLKGSQEMIAIHLPHEAPPPEAKDPVIVNKNAERLKAKLIMDWKTNMAEVEWGILKK